MGAYTTKEMIRIKSIFIVVAIILFLTGKSIADAPLCNNIEFAELKAISKKDLFEEYCQTKKMLNHLYSKKPDINLMDNQLDNISYCLDLQQRILRVYKMRFKKDPPECKEKN